MGAKIIFWKFLAQVALQLELRAKSLNSGHFLTWKHHFQLFVKFYSFSIKYLGFQFKKWLTFNSNVNSSWKQEALNGDYEYVGMSKFDEPYFKRSYGGKDVFLSLWGPEGKRKWRIGPDVNTKGKVSSLIYSHIYGSYYEMPQKACERWFCHVIAFAIFLKCPKIKEFHFRFFFYFEIDHVFFLNAQLSYVLFLNAPFFISDSENGKNEDLKKGT